MATNPLEIVPLSDIRLPAAVDTLAQAFALDPTSTYFFPEISKRPEGLRQLVQTALRHGLLGGAVDSVQNEAGIAVWIPSNQARLSLARMLKIGVPRAALKAGLGAARRILTFADWIEKQREEALPVPHWYLLDLAVRPDCQGRGLGSALLQHGLARAARERLPCFLETTNTRNLPLYQRHGFRIVYEGDPPGGGPHVWGFAQRQEAS